MDDVAMWQAILTETYIETEAKPGRTLLISSHKVGIARPDANAAWKDAEEFLEKHEKRKNSLVQISICPDGYHREQAGGGSAITPTLN